MDIKELSKEQLKYVFKNCYKQDFPIAERKSTKTIINLIEDGKYFCYGSFEEEKLLSYLFFFKEDDVILLDYFAVCGDNKNKGIGGKTLEIFKEKFKDYLIIGEIEVSSSDEKGNNILVERRKNFYQRHNMLMSDIYMTLWNVKFQIIVYPKIDKQILLSKLEHYYKCFYGIEKFKKNIKFDN